ncbi:MAG: LamG-like jellyroll fold domain-containing protein, partial [Bacteroidota bacterium]
MTRNAISMKALNKDLIPLAISLTIIIGCKSDSTDPAPPDTVPPTVSIPIPTNNSTVTDSILVSAIASDNVGVEKVEFYIDGELRSTRSTVPWQYNWVVQDLSGNSIHTILAKAYDAAQNVGSSATVNVTVNRTVQALQFNGSTDYVRLPSSASLTSFSNQITIETWVQIVSYGSGGQIIASGNENEYALAVKSDGRLAVTMVFINPQANHEFIGKTVLGLSTWYHVAFTYNGSIESILINGIVDTSFSSSGAINSSQYDENISIGAYSYNNHALHSTFLSGILDELRIWDVSRS